ncbi:MAG TPA: PAS domain S-box protein, partial [Vicinamibacteria bacterium]|nr:PAS domain S-box protein [Vicinamibacteria bacterium]
QRRSLAASLKERGFEVVEAASGDEGLSLLSDDDAVVLCDLNMPGMDGLEVLRRVQRRRPEVPFILLTAHPSIPIAVQAIVEGAQRFLIKPVSLDEMEISIHQAIEFARLQRWQREAEEQLLRLIEAVPVPYIITRLRDGKILYANRHLAEMVGLTPDEMKNRNTVDFYYDPEMRVEVLERLKRDGFVTDLEVRVKRANGSPMWTVFSLANSEMAGEKVVLGGFLDITRRKELEDRLHLYKEVFKHSVDVIMVIDKEGHILERNPAHERRTGFTEEDLKGKTIFDMLTPEMGATVREAMNTEGHFAGEIEGISKDGERIPVLVSVFPIHDEQGRLNLYVSMGRDITAIKRALTDLAETNRELRQAQAQLVQSEKMASLGGLVAGIAHEINTPVGAMTSMHDTLVRATAKLKEHLKEKDPGVFETDERLKSLFAMLDESNTVIRSGASRVAEIVRRLRSFARLDEAELKKVDIHEGLEDTLTLVHHEIKHNIQVVRDYGKLPLMSVFPSRLNQVFLNLLNNARQAIGEKGTITIRTWLEDKTANIAITDDGVGIPPENLPRVFDPGFTTKGVGIGTGLGLSICYQIIKDHRGKIDVESEVGRGTTFTIRIPTNLDEILGVS